MVSVFSKTQLPPELRHVLSWESSAVFLHFPLEGKGLLSAPVGGSKRETPTSNLTESTVGQFQSIYSHISYLEFCLSVSFSSWIIPF